MTPYKAWEVFVIDHEDEGHEIAYADTRNEAKYKLLDGECKTCGNLCADSNLEYLDLSARRLKACDGLGDEPVSVVLEAAIRELDGLAILTVLSTVLMIFQTRKAWKSLGAYFMSRRQPCKKGY